MPKSCNNCGKTGVRLTKVNIHKFVVYYCEKCNAKRKASK